MVYLTKINIKTTFSRCKKQAESNKVLELLCLAKSNANKYWFCLHQHFDDHCNKLLAWIDLHIFTIRELCWEENK